MQNNLLKIIPFVVVTVTVFGLVELFYGLMDHYFLSADKAETRVNITREQPRMETGTTPEQFSDYSIITERNLFGSLFQESAPQPENDDPFAGIEATQLELVLMGTITGQDGGDRAIILKKRDNKQEIFYQGDVIEGALIKTIDRGRIILEYQGNDEVLDMSEASTIRRSQVAAEVRAAPTPSPQPRRVIQGSTVQEPRRRIISPGGTVDDPEIELPPEEGFGEELQEGLDEEIIEQEFIPEEERQE